MTPTWVFAGVADALVALVEHGEDEFAARFDKLFADVPLLPWPAWAYMSALAPIRALLPDGEQLDGLDVGPSLRVAIDAGRAVAELRRTGDPGARRRCPGSRSTCCGSTSRSPMLCELALAASATVPAANASLALIPHCSRWISRLVAHPSPAVRRAADIAVKVYPPRPEHPLRITTLGRFCRRVSARARSSPDGTGASGCATCSPSWSIRRSVPRSDLAAAIWPDLAPEKAANNLRVNLHHVQQLLEPGRSPDAPPAYLQATATGLRLSTDDVTIDTDLFDARIAEALAAERRGSPSQALVHYEEACDLYRGEFLPGMEQESIVNERTRLRSVAHGALCRRGELVLARGEPEIALALAAAAQQVDEMSERAGRLAIKCHLAVGSTSAACAVARQVGDVLADARVEPDPETRRLLERPTSARSDRRLASAAREAQNWRRSGARVSSRRCGVWPLNVSPIEPTMSTMTWVAVLENTHTWPAGSGSTSTKLATSRPAVTLRLEATGRPAAHGYTVRNPSAAAWVAVMLASTPPASGAIPAAATSITLVDPAPTGAPPGRRVSRTRTGVGERELGGRVEHGEEVDEQVHVARRDDAHLTGGARSHDGQVRGRGAGAVVDVRRLGHRLVARVDGGEARRAGTDGGHVERDRGSRRDAGDRRDRDAQRHTGRLARRRARVARVGETLRTGRHDTGAGREAPGDVDDEVGVGERVHAHLTRSCSPARSPPRRRSDRGRGCGCSRPASPSRTGRPSGSRSSAATWW